MRRARMVMAGVLTLVALARAAWGGGDEEEDKKATPPPSESPSGGGGGGATAPSTPPQLPPELVKCYEKRGYKVESPADIHSAPPQVVQECFAALHQGGEAP